ncbi:hypothetical protein Peur_016513 [Populus x canadensis]
MNGKTKRDQKAILVINGGQYLMICPKSSMHWKPPVFSSVNHTKLISTSKTYRRSISITLKEFRVLYLICNLSKQKGSDLVTKIW